MVSTRNPTRIQAISRVFIALLICLTICGILGIMKKIPLTQDKFASVDDIDYAFLMQWKWFFSQGYAVRNSRKSDGLSKHTGILMHRVVLIRKLDTLISKKQTIRIEENLTTHVIIYVLHHVHKTKAIERYNKEVHQDSRVFIGTNVKRSIVPT